MNQQFVQLQKWVNKRSNKEKLYLFVSGFLGIYLVYFLIFLRPVLTAKKEYVEQISVLQTQQMTTKQQLKNLQELSKTPVFMEIELILLFSNVLQIEILQQ